MIPETSYRGDIDGLRALAVGGVVLYHAGFDWIPGGFVGVDIFFVISGYLITSIILAHEGSVREFLLRFYERRIRRLIPPTIPVFCFVGLFSWLLFPGEGLRDLGQSFLSFLFFASNWYFWLGDGYFDAPSELKPLLHTWSLSIEEQFYILFPAPILLLNRYGICAVRWFLCAVLFISLSYGATLIAIEDSSGAFFNSFARFWEIAVGGVLATLTFRGWSRSVRHMVGGAGLCVILFSLFYYAEGMAFPGLTALAPTLGTAMVIASRGSFVSRLLEIRPVVWLGLISYALYLWHWPIFAFLDFALIAPAAHHLWVGIAASVGLSIASYFLIEGPVRRRKFFQSGKSLGITYLTSTAALASLGIAVVLGDGFPARFPAAVEYERTLAGLRSAQRQAASRADCWMGGVVDMEALIRRCLDPASNQTDVLLVGDSHAAQFRAGLASEWPSINVDLLATDSCTMNYGFREACDETLEWLSGDDVIKYERVIISVFGNSREDADGMAEFAIELSETVPVTVLGPIQFYQPNLPSLFPRFYSSVPSEDLNSLLDRAIQSDQFEISRDLEDLFDGSGVQFVSLLKYTCPYGPVTCMNLDSEGLPVTIDNSHLSVNAAGVLVSQFAPQIVISN
ncbi:acyltransferase family protein [Fodinicurvata sp. EGI_FJ10296]|uniref:acyltransferase family protein n=1 Tax=Fodinicurvata sp. EGI_FJ10296 TaxID=3231908 RepID=UPI00345550D5